MSFRAMHKPTGKVIEARKLESDPIWKTKVKDEWIFIPRLIPLDIQRQMDKKGITKLKVSFTKSHSREDNWVRAHFKRESLEGINLDNLENESDEHKLCKEGIYYEIIDDNLLIDFGEKITKKISELCSDYDCNMEERLSSERNTKIGDIVLTFDKEHTILGNGIVFEVQFSNQSFEKTITRTNDRVLKGYSVSWLWVGQFDDENKLLSKTIKVVPFREALKKFDENFEESFIKNYEGIQNDIEDKLEDLETKKQCMYSEITKAVNIINDESNKKIREFYNEFSDIVNKQIKTFHPNTLDTIYKYTENVLKGINIHDEIINLIQSKVNTSINSIINDFKNENIIPKLNSLNNEINKILNSTKEKYDKLLSEKINSLIDERKEEFFNEAFNNAIKNVPEEIANKIKEKLELFKCDNCNCETPYNDIHWNGGIKKQSLCSKCWVKICNPLNEKMEGKNEKKESEGLERFSS